MRFEDIRKIKLNPNNPRFIRDNKFEQLVNSIRTFPQMLELRPIVVNENMEALGGNMRLRACIEAGLTKVPIIDGSHLTPDQQREFIIKDNVGYGEWNCEQLENEWDAIELLEWGLDLPIDSQADIETESLLENVIKVTFKTPEDVQRAESEIQDMLDREYDGAYLSINL